MDSEVSKEDMHDVYSPEARPCRNSLVFLLATAGKSSKEWNKNGTRPVWNELRREEGSSLLSAHTRREDMLAIYEFLRRHDNVNIDQFFVL